MKASWNEGTAVSSTLSCPPQGGVREAGGRPEVYHDICKILTELYHTRVFSLEKTFVNCLEIDLMVTQCTTPTSTVSNGNPVHHAH